MSTVIKAGKSGTLLRSLATVDLADHLSEARAVLQRARVEAVSILENAHREAAERAAAGNRDIERAKSEAREEGVKEGFAAGFAEGRKAGFDSALEEARKRFAEEQARLIEALTGVVGKLEASKSEVVSKAERELLEFAVTAASKMTFAIGERRCEAVAENFKRALRLVAGQSVLRVRVHPQDEESLRVFAPQALSAVSQSEALSFETDEAIAPGGCVVEGRTTRVDATLDTQIAEMTRLLLGERGEGG